MKIPVLCNAKSVVIGDGFTAVETALRLANQKKETKRSSVVLVARETFLGRELCVWGRYYVPEVLAQTAFFDGCTRPALSRDGYVPVHPDALKKRLEDLVLAAGIQIVYGAVFIGAVETARGTAALIAGKFGVQAVLCDTCYPCMPHPAPQESKEIKRTVSLAGVTRLSAFAAQLEASPYAERVRIFPGAFDPHHAILEITTAYDPNLKGDARLLHRSTEDCFMALEALYTELPALHGVRLGRMGLRPFTESQAAFTTIAAAATSNSPLPKPVPVNKRITLGCGVLRENAAAAQNGQLMLDIDIDGTPPEKIYDIIICGGGTSGVPAALAACGKGAKTALLDMNTMLGGTATIGGVSSYWFGNRGAACTRIEEKTEAWHKRLHQSYPGFWWSPHDKWNADIRAFVLLDEALSAGAEVYLDTVTAGAITEGEAINGASAFLEGSETLLRAPVTVDTTGDGDVAAFAGAPFTYGSESDGITFWASLGQYISPADHKNNFTGTVYTADPLDYSRFIIANRRQGGDCFDHGAYVAPRESRHIKGVKSLTLKDVLLHKQHEDTVHQCFSNYDPKGRVTADIVRFGLLPPNLPVNIPFSAMVPERLDGVIVAGKAFSVTHDAFPGVRMQPDLMELGAAAGMLAAYCAQHGKQPRTLTPAEIREALNRPAQADPPITRELRQALMDLNGSEPFEWIDMNVREAIRTTPPHVQIMLSEASEALPLLLGAYENAQGRLALTLARLLLWHGDASGAPRIEAAIINAFTESRPGLPRRNGSVSFCQMLPDHGVMPEPVYDLNLLANAKAPSLFALMETVTDRLAQVKRDYFDIRAGIYCYIEAVAYAAERLEDARFARLLQTITDFEEFHRLEEEGAQNPLRERLWLLYADLMKALYALDPCAAEPGLLRLCRCPVRQIAFSARRFTANAACRSDRSRV